MKTINAILNHGRWVALCPSCAANGVTSAALVSEKDALFICAEEYPDILATMNTPHPRRKRAFITVADEETRKEARQTALEAGAAYEVIFPADKKTIDAALFKRPISARNWEPSHTLDDLLRENAERGL